MKKLEIPQCFRCLKSEQPFHHPDHGGISSERDHTRTTGSPQAPDRAAPRPGQPARLPPTHDDRHQHPLRDRRPHPRHRPRRHRRHPRAGPQDRPDRRHRPDGSTCSRFHLPYHESDHVLNIAYNALCGGDLPAKTSSCAATTRSSSTPWAPAASPTRPPPATSAAASRAPTSRPCSRRLQRRPHRRLGRAARRVLRAGHHRRRRHLVETTGQCKQGMDIAYDGTWGYHPLVVTLANTGEVLCLVNRSGNRPSHEGAADAGRSLPGGLLSRRLPPGAAAGRHRLLADRSTSTAGTPTGACASSSATTPCPTSRTWPRTLPENGWQPLERPPRYDVQTAAARSGPTTSRSQIVVAREFETMRLQAEEVAEFDYRPTACRKTLPDGRGPQEHLGREGGAAAVRRGSATSSTSPTTGMSPAAEIVFSANDRCDQENLIAQLKRRGAGAAGAGGQPGEQLGVHGDDGVGLEPEGVVGAVAAGGAGPLAGAAPEPRSGRCCGWSSRRFVHAFVELPCQIVRSGRRLVYRLLSWNPHLPIFFRLVERLRC